MSVYFFQFSYFKPNCAKWNKSIVKTLVGGIKNSRNNADPKGSEIQKHD
jgi:hypothetical protein